MLKVGIISANWGAYAHLPAWRAIQGVEVTAICTSRRETAEAAAARHGIPRAFWNADTMVADPDIDIIDCGTRPSIREAHVVAALSRGKHVYNAIPFARDLDGARRLHAAWETSGTIAITDAYSEWLPVFQVARRMLDDNYIGKPFGGSCTFTMSLFNRLLPQFPYNWFAQEGLGVSAVRNLGSHALNLLVFLFGAVAEVVAHDGQLLPEWRAEDGTVIPARTNDFASMILRFESGLVMQFQVSWNAPLGPGFALEAFGSDGRIEIAGPSFPTVLDTTLRAGKLGDTAVAPVAIPPVLLAAPEIGIDPHFPVPPAYPMALSMHAMVEAIHGTGKAHPDFAQGWYVERVQEAVRLSQAERRWVRIDEIA